MPFPRPAIRGVQRLSDGQHHGDFIKLHHGQLGGSASVGDGLRDAPPIEQALGPFKKQALALGLT